ncbi:MAG: pyridoxal phosphate-dependent aminotransferase [Chloroflexi bacterium]|nr:pyridoxal phosphate-dependent aminotransferase [Chloroflexota bacterium]
MKISSRLGAIAPSATMAIEARQRAMKRDGLPVISFGAGEPDFPTPAAIAAAGTAAIAAGHTKYTSVNGVQELREAVAERLRRDQQLQYSPDQVIITNGAKEALFNTFQALLNPGDEVIIPAPYWVSYEAQVLFAGGKPVIVSTTEESGFKLTPDALAAHITPRTRLLMLNSPSNPTGSVYSADELRGLGSVLANSDVGVVSDEIYQRISYNGPSPSFPAAVPDLFDRTILINGASKAYAMTGWRIGFAAGPLNVIKAMNGVQSHSTSNANTIAQYAAIEAFGGRQDEVDKMSAAFKERRDVIVGLLNEIPGVQCPVPDGAFYVFPSVKGALGKTIGGETINSSLELATYLLEKAYVATVPGEAFGSPGYLRLSYACGMAPIREGVARLKSALTTV